ncbi:MAG: hypothetical protein KDK30_00005 [Leptospiraceae bacterium]|nr:hypothetical protein [Leptospiraceae bacterium]
MQSHIKPQSLQSPSPGFKSRLRAVGAIILPALLAGTLLASDDSDRLTFGWLQGADWRGKAEVAVYDGTVVRYRQQRPASLTLITVTEPFNTRQVVKSESGENAITALKQNQVLKYQTGVYPYSQMNSVFWNASTGDFFKASMTTQEWCGQTFKEARRYGDGLRLAYNSYWEDEAVGEMYIEDPHEDTLYILYDELPLAVRTEQLQKAGRVYLFPMLMSSQVMRSDWDIGHPARKPTYTPAIVNTERVTLNAARRNFQDVLKVTITFEDGGAKKIDTFYVDMNDPNRLLLKWERNDGGQFTISELYYTDYWNQNRAGDRLTGSRL